MAQGPHLHITIPVKEEFDALKIELEGKVPGAKMTSGSLIKMLIDFYRKHQP